MKPAGVQIPPLYRVPLAALHLSETAPGSAKCA
jgi:hypothetical protein